MDWTPKSKAEARTACLFYFAKGSSRRYDAHQMEMLMRISAKEAFKEVSEGSGEGAKGGTGNEYMVFGNGPDANRKMARRLQSACDYINAEFSKSEKENFIFYMYRVMAPQPNTVMPNDMDLELFFTIVTDMGFGMQEALGVIREATSKR